MANISTAYCELQFSNIFELTKANDLLRKCQSSPYIIGFSEVFDYKTLPEKNLIIIIGNGRWNVDFEVLINLLSDCKYSGVLTDEEPGNDFFNKIIIENSEVVSDETYPYLSIECFNMNPDISYWLESYAWVFEEPNWRNKWEHIYNFFLEIGVTEEEIKEWENE